MAESFFATFKKELLRDVDFATRRQARLAIFDYIEGFYNTRRLHSALGFQSPTGYEGRTAQGAPTKGLPGRLFP